MKDKDIFCLNNIITQQLISATKAWFLYVMSHISRLPIEIKTQMSI